MFLRSARPSPAFLGCALALRAPSAPAQSLPEPGRRTIDVGGVRRSYLLHLPEAQPLLHLPEAQPVERHFPSSSSSGGGHTRPGGPPVGRTVGRVTRDIDATTVMLDFFDRHPRP